MPASEIPRLLFISDSLAQTGLPLFKSLLSEADEGACLLCAQSNYKALLPQESHKIKVLDALRSKSSHENVQSIQGLPLEQLYTLIASMQVSTLYIDSLNALEKNIPGQDLYKLFKRLIYQSDMRLVMLHHSDLSSIPKHHPYLDLQALFCQPAFSSSIVYYTLHPIPLLNHLYTSFNTASEDPRIYGYLSRFHKQSYGGYGYRRDAADETEQSVSLDSLSNSKIGQCVLQWEAQGVAAETALQILGGKARPPSGFKRVEKEEHASTFKTGVKIHRGLNGLQMARDGDKVNAIELRALGNWMEGKGHKKIPTAGNIQSAMPEVLPFNLSLTDNQRQAKDNVVLPYLPKLDSTQSQSSVATQPTGRIFYEPDKADDVDEEDPDDD